MVRIIFFRMHVKIAFISRLKFILTYSKILIKYMDYLVT